MTRDAKWVEVVGAASTLVCATSLDPALTAYSPAPSSANHSFDRSLEERPMIGVLFEVVRRGELWRLEVSHHKGRTFAQWRAWWSDRGEWKPTKKGTTFSLARLRDLHVVLEEYLDGHDPARL